MVTWGLQIHHVTDLGGVGHDHPAHIGSPPFGHGHGVARGLDHDLVIGAKFGRKGVNVFISQSPSVDHGSVGSADTGTAILPEAIRSPSSSLCCGTTLPLTRRGSSS